MDFYALKGFSVNKKTSKVWSKGKLSLLDIYVLEEELSIWNFL